MRMYQIRELHELVSSTNKSLAKLRHHLDKIESAFAVLSLNKTPLQVLATLTRYAVQQSHQAEQLLQAELEAAPVRVTNQSDETIVLERPCPDAPAEVWRETRSCDKCGLLEDGPGPLCICDTIDAWQNLPHAAKKTP